MRTNTEHLVVGAVMTTNYGERPGMSEQEFPPADPKCPRCHGTGRMAYLDRAGDPDMDVCDCIIDADNARLRERADAAADTGSDTARSEGGTE